MPHLHPYHQILLRKAIVNEYKGNFDKILKGNEIKNLAANDLNVSYNTLRKLFLSTEENSNFQEYTLIKIIWYISKQKNDFKFSENKSRKFWYNFQKYFPTPQLKTELNEIHFNTLVFEVQDKLQDLALNLLISFSLKEIDFSSFTEKILPTEKSKKQEINSKKIPIEGTYAVYRTDNKNRFLEKRYARIFKSNSKLEFELLTSGANYESIIFEYKYPSVFLVFDNGMSKISFSLHTGNIRMSEVLMGTYSHFSVSAGKADAGIVVLVKQNLENEATKNLQGKSIPLNSKLTDKEEITMLTYFKSVNKPSFISESAINLLEIEQLSQEENDRNHLKQNEIIRSFYTGTYFLYGKNKNDDQKIIKSPCKIFINENNKATFEISGRTYSFKSKSISLINNFLYVDIDNKLFNDKGFYTFSLSPTTKPKFITGIASFINAENKPMSRRVVLYKYSNSISDYENLSNSSIEKENKEEFSNSIFNNENLLNLNPQKKKELSRYDKTILTHFEKLENNIIIDERIF